MAYEGTLRSIQAADRRQQRIAEKRRCDLDRRAKQQAKLSEIEKARCEVEIFENQIELLLSIHKEQGPVWDWRAIAGTLSPPKPRRSSHNELRARQLACLALPDHQQASTLKIDQARLMDDQVYQEEVQNHASETDALEKLQRLARRIVAGEPKAYTDALLELSPLAELSSLGSSMHFSVHGTQLMECVIKVKGTEAIPPEVKSLTATEKLSVKPMPRARFHELYQDYICGCILRIAREVFALLPVSTLLITATADALDPSMGTTAEKSVLSAVIARASIDSLHFDHLDPSDAIDTFPHRGDFKASRKSGAFAPIIPLTPADIPDKAPVQMDAVALFAETKRLREELQAAISMIKPSRATAPEAPPAL